VYSSVAGDAGSKEWEWRFWGWEVAEVDDARSGIVGVESELLDGASCAS
jgi:hypothetical protein